jgi:hypothetical protein
MAVAKLTYAKQEPALKPVNGVPIDRRSLCENQRSAIHSASLASQVGSLPMVSPVFTSTGRA